MRTLRRIIAEKWQESLVLTLMPLIVGLVIPTGKPIVIVSTVVVAILTIVAVFSIAERSRRKAPAIDAEEAFQLKRKGVIFTIGLHSDKPDSVVYLVLQNLKPDVVGFLGTPQTVSVVDKLCAVLRLDRDHVKSENWDAINLREGKTKTGIIIDWMMDQGLSKRDIVVDLTAGTTTLSIAAFMMAQECEIDSQYIFSEFDPVKNEKVPGSQRPRLITRYTETG